MVEPYKIGGKKYFTIRQFADITGRTVQSVRHLIAKGNRVRKLKVERIGGRPFIPVSELTEFPFTMPGASKEEYHYDADGNILNYAVQN